MTRGAAPRRGILAARPRSSVDRAADFESACGGSIPPGATHTWLDNGLALMFFPFRFSAPVVSVRPPLTLG